MSEFIFSENLTALLKERKIKMSEAAHAVGVTKQSMSDYCHGRIAPKYSVLIKLADFLGVTCDFLLTGSGLTTQEQRKSNDLSPASIHNLKNRCSPELFNHLDSMLSDTNFYAAMKRFFSVIDTEGLFITKLLQELPINESVIMQYKRTVQIQDALDFTLSEETRELAKYFGSLTLKNAEIKNARKLLTDKIDELLSVPVTE